MQGTVKEGHQNSKRPAINKESLVADEIEVVDLMAAANAVVLIEGGTQMVTTIKGFDMTRLPELVLAIQTKVKGLYINEAAIAKGGKTKAGGKGVPFAAKRDEPSPCCVTVWANGTVVFAGMDAVRLPPIVKPA